MSTTSTHCDGCNFLSSGELVKKKTVQLSLCFNMFVATAAGEFYIYIYVSLIHVLSALVIFYSAVNSIRSCGYLISVA